MNVMMTPIVIGALGTIPKVLESEWEELEIGGQTENKQTTS